ncbi:MAG: YcaQ family DNA glycosylase, partial [Anaerolineales bacterium]|nr:YcaQ family DNA glycosylase [Anaerolineales bacterium]
PMNTLTRQEARRLAISRQHLDGRERPSMLDVIRDLGCVQLDPIRHVERTHLLVLWSRLGAFDRAALRRLRFEERALFEYWAHAASLVLTEELPLHAWFMRQHAARKSHGKWFEEHRDVFQPLLDDIQAQLRQNGPLLSRDLDVAVDLRLDSRWWSSVYTARLIDILWTRGDAMVFDRVNNHRVWGMAADFWPAWAAHEVWDEVQVTRFAVQKAVRALGVATPKQIKQHFTRGRYPKLTAVLKQLLHEGLLHEVSILGADGEPLRGPWYLHAADAPLLAAIRAGSWQGRTTLLSPFDNLICDRDRTEALFDFFFRIEIYVPKKKRQFGYYVLPILHGDRLIGRVDAQMDRKTGTLRLARVFAEAGAPADAAALAGMAAAVADLARFLEAEAIAWGELPPAWAALASL